MSSRFTRLERPLMAPGECMVCKNYALPVVDFNVALQAFNGKLYLCEECLRDGLLTVNPDAFNTDQTDWKTYAKSLETLIESTRKDVNDLIDSATGIYSRTAGLSSDPALAVNEESDADAESSGKRTGKGKSTSSKQRSDDVSGTKLDELLGLE